MRKLYWRPPGVSRAALLLITMVAIAALVSVESFPVQQKQALYSKKIAAARLANQAMRLIKAEKQRRGILADIEADPAQSGMIGSPITPITSNTGYISAKRTSANPNFAAVLVEMLRRAGVEQGDLVAVGVSGSFPALNLAVYAAIQTMELRPIIISSTASSEWGANHVEFTWLDMERLLFDKKVFHFRSIAASRGGIDDRGYGMSKHGRALLDASIERNGLPRIEAESVEDSIERRMEVYDEHAGTKPVKVYINVGGGSASVGTHVGKKQFLGGLNLQIPRGVELVDSVMLRFLNRDAAVIHMSGISRIAKQYGLPIEPKQVRPVGEGNVYVKAEYNRWLAIAGILAILGSMLAFIRLDVGMRLFRTRRHAGDAQPQQMI